MNQPTKPISILVTLNCGCTGGNNRADLPQLGIHFTDDDPAEAAARAVRYAILHHEAATELSQPMSPIAGYGPLSPADLHHGSEGTTA